MADIRPFRGLRYNAAMFGRDLTAVVCPPFDVISPADQSALYARHPSNIVRLELTRPEPGDHVPVTRYERAATEFEAWQREGILIQDPSPALYGYSVEFSLDGSRHERRGIVASMRLEPWERRVVLPHERTLAAAKQDRMALMRACMANFSPIWGLYHDVGGATERFWSSTTGQVPDEEATDDDGMLHRLWLVRDPAITAAVHAALSAGPVYIADGHHRYTTALALRDELQSDATSADPHAAANFVLTYLVEAADPGLIVLGTHRLLTSPVGVDSATIRRTIEGAFEVEDVQADPAALIGRVQEVQGRPAFALWAPSLGMSLVARAHDPEGVPASLADGHSASWRRLDLAVLHTLVIDQLFDVGTTALSESGRLTYPRNLEDVEGAIHSGAADVAFLVRQTPISQITSVADAGDLMPEKSTFFYPKPLTGMVVASLRGSVPEP